MACERPAQRAQPLSRYSLGDLQRVVSQEAAVGPISRSTLWRLLDRDVLKPWRYRLWIFPRDPAFAVKAGRVLDRYAGWWEGAPLGPDEYVLSADEKTSIQARCRCHPGRPPRPGHPQQVEFEYERRGAVQYLAAWDVRRGRVFGRCEAHTGCEPFGRLVEQVMSQAPYRSAARVFWIVDNGSSHRGAAASRRLQGAYRNLILVHLPLHASWLNQIEIYFSVVQRKALMPDAFATRTEVTTRLLGFQRHYQRMARPFEWRFSRADLAKLLRRCSPLQQHRPAA